MAAGISVDYNKLSVINACYQNSMTFVAEALEEDENSNTTLATEYYMNALRLLEDGIRVDISGPQYTGSEWKIAKQQQERMLSAHVKTKQRLYDIQEHNSIPSAPANAPTYSANVPEGHQSILRGADNNYDISDATELLHIPSGVQLFFVSADHHVGTTPPSYPSFLKVLVIEGLGQLFIQVAEWIYPLIQGETPVLKTSNEAYLFPNRNSPSGGISPGSIGIVISSEVDRGLIDTFENILQNLALFRQQDSSPDEDVLNLSDSVHVTEEESSVSDKIASGLEKGAEWLSYGLSKGAEYTTGLVNKGSGKIKENITPNSEPSTVDPMVQKGLYYTHEASKATVKVSRFLVDGLYAITSRVSQEVAPHIKEYSKKVLPTSMTTSDEKDGSTMDGVIKVAGAGLSGFGTVWTELEKSSLAIARAVSTATVENVKFKYGKEAGQVTYDAMGSVVNVGKTAFNLDNLGIKAIAKRTAKDTGKAFLQEYTTETKEKPVNGVKDNKIPD